MFPYICLVVLPFFFSFFAVKKDENKKLKLIIGNTEYVKKENISVYIFFMLLFVILAVRSELTGNDLLNYKYYFKIYSQKDFVDILAFKPETLYWILNWLIGQITDNYQFFLVAVALISVWPIAKAYYEYKNHSFLKIILFLNMSTFVMLFSGLRQSVAMAIGLIAYKFVKKKKCLLFLICVIIALGFHHSAFVLFFMYPVYHMSINKKNVLFIIPIIMATFIFNKEIFSFLGDVLVDLSGVYDSQSKMTGAYGSLILFVIFAIFVYIIPDERKMDLDLIGERNIILIVVLIQCFAPIHSLAMRMNYYYILMIPMLIPKIIDVAKIKYKQLAIFANYFMCIFFALDFVMSVYMTYMAGGGALSTIPYIPFWQ